MSPTVDWTKDVAKQALVVRLSHLSWWQRNMTRREIITVVPVLQHLRRRTVGGRWLPEIG